VAKKLTNVEPNMGSSGMISPSITLSKRLSRGP
jgi:hypothetical protein